MGLVKIDKFSASGRIGFWKTEDPGTLSPTGRKQGLSGEFLRFLNQFPGLERERIVYDERGKPHLTDPLKGHISISHSGGMLVMTHDISAPTGVDYERVRDKIFRIAPRFMGRTELSEAGDSPAAERLHIYWGAKEALFKKHGAGGLLFSKHLYISPFLRCEEGETKGVISLNGQRSEHRIAYKKYDDHMLVYIIND